VFAVTVNVRPAPETFCNLNKTIEPNVKFEIVNVQFAAVVQLRRATTIAALFVFMLELPAGLPRSFNDDSSAVDNNNEEPFRIVASPEALESVVNCA